MQKKAIPVSLIATILSAAIIIVITIVFLALYH